MVNITSLATWRHFLSNHVVTSSLATTWRHIATTWRHIATTWRHNYDVTKFRACALPGPIVPAYTTPDFVSVSDPGPGKTSPESGDMLTMSDFVSDFDPGPEEPLLQSEVSLTMPNFAERWYIAGAGICECRWSRARGTSPESGDILAMPDLVSNFDLGPGEPLLKSGVGLDHA